MSYKIWDTISTLVCTRCDEVFSDEEESRCPRCWDTDKVVYAIAKITHFEELER